jgi:hypothetical protein
VKIYMLSRYITKCKYTLKMIQIIAKLNEILSHILNKNWLYHFNYNWKVWLIWFHKKHLDKIFIQKSISVLKKTFCWKFTFIWKMTRIMLEAFVLKFILYVYQNVRWNFLKKLPPKYTQIYPKITHFFGLKRPPCSVLSPLSLLLELLKVMRDSHIRCLLRLLKS